jgi:hypothetical protein
MRRSCKDWLLLRISIGENLALLREFLNHEWMRIDANVSGQFVLIRVNSRFYLSSLVAATLLCSLLTLMSSNVAAETRLHRSISLDRKEPSLTHTVFYGSECGFNTAPASARSDNGVTRFPTITANSAPGRYPWKYNITTTVFWVGEQATQGNPVPNTQSAWDLDWVSNYGGYDDPTQRASFTPIGFTPRQNPFYAALPYNDVTESHTRPEAGLVIPWFKNSFVRDGQSVCKGRWLAIRHGRRLCYAQWEDVGPFQTNHWQYVFGSERPRPNINRDAGLDVSPAVRDYLGMSGMDACDWRFVDLDEVPDGPWALCPENNPVARLGRLRRSVGTAMAKKVSIRSRFRRSGS